MMNFFEWLFGIEKPKVSRTAADGFGHYSDQMPPQKLNTPPTPSTSILNEQDELLGIWDREEDELFFMWGWGVEFLPDGKGLDRCWGRDARELGLGNEEFLWERLGPKTIKLKSEDEDWETIEYEITQVQGYRDAYYLKLSNKGTDHFWYMHEPVYRALR